MNWYDGLIVRNYTIESLPEAEKAKMRRRHPGGAAQIDLLFAHARAFFDSYDDLNFAGQDLARIRARTLIVQGDCDPFYRVSISEEIAAAVPNSELWIVRVGGHAPIGGESWAEFVRRAGQFLRDGRWFFEGPDHSATIQVHGSAGLDLRHLHCGSAFPQGGSGDGRCAGAPGLPDRLSV